MSAQELKYQQQPAASSEKPARVQLDHLLLDRDFFRKPKILLFLNRFGPSATIWLTDLLGILSGATDAEIETEVAHCTSVMFGVKEPETAIQYCLEHGILVAPRPGYLSNSRVIKDQEACAIKRDRWRKKKRTQRGRKGGHSGGPLNTEHLNTEDLKEDSQPESPTPKKQKPQTPPGFREGTEKSGDHIWLSDDEIIKLEKNYGVQLVKSKMKSLEAGIENRTRKYLTYRNHYKVIDNWCCADQTKNNGKL